MCVSVIIPTFNRAATLLATVRSVLQQTETRFEIIVVDDGSTDGTPELIAAAEFSGDPRFHYLRTSNRGVSHARNLGIANARYDLIAFLDSDDTWASAKLARSLPPLESGADLVYTDALVTINHSHRQYLLSSRSKPHEGNVFLPLLRNNFICTSTVIVKKSVLISWGMFYSLFQAIEDYHLWLRLAPRIKVAYVPEALTFYTMHKKSLSSLNVLSNYWRVAWVRIANFEKLRRMQRVVLILQILRKVPKVLLRSTIGTNLLLWLHRRNVRHPQGD